MPNELTTKVFCIGFQKTGTSSMRDALQQLGYRVADYYGSDMELEALRRDYVTMGLDMAREHDAVQDMPFPLLFRELDKAFPASKFILTTREVESWYLSMVKHFGSVASPVRQLTYGEAFPFPEGHAERYKLVYEAHNCEVLEYFADRPGDLLIMDLEKGDGWEKLAAFLGRDDAPSGPFVHSNKAELRDTLSFRVKRLAERVRRRVVSSPR